MLEWRRATQSRKREGEKSVSRTPRSMAPIWGAAASFCNCGWRATVRLRKRMKISFAANKQGGAPGGGARRHSPRRL